MNEMLLNILQWIILIVICFGFLMFVGMCWACYNGDLNAEGYTGYDMYMM